MLDKLEEKYGFKVENLNPIEKETFFKMLEDVNKSQLTPDKLKDYIRTTREAVEKELIGEPEFIYIFIFKFPNRKQIMLKARLMNYLLLEAFLTTKERAEEYLEQVVSSSFRKI